MEWQIWRGLLGALLKGVAIALGIIVMLIYFGHYLAGKV